VSDFAQLFIYGFLGEAVQFTCFFTWEINRLSMNRLCPQDYVITHLGEAAGKTHNKKPLSRSDVFSVWQAW
jgi:hypothetical protein